MQDLEIFLNAPKSASAGELAAYLEEACGADRELRERVEELIAAEDSVQEFMERAPVADAADEIEAMIGAERAGDMVGQYKLLQKIGEGGFGEVWMAEQSEPIQRVIALKLVKAGMDTKLVLARFEAERQALAMMDHPNIAKVHEAGATASGRPYFVMELVRGVTITQFCVERHQGPRRRLELFGDVCSAVNHAHQKGIIHRDLKPSNVMVTLVGDRPVVKVIDFGIAKAMHSKLTEKTIFTRFEQFMGTPAYMSPEQAAMSSLDVDTRADIYSLGVLLYELLTGRPPFDERTLLSAGVDEMRRIIREVDPPRPSTKLTESLSSSASSSRSHTLTPRSLRGDLDWIVMKAIDKDRGRRYQTANSFARDILRYLNGEAVEAVAPRVGYKLGKFVRRNRSGVVMAATIVVLLVGGTSASTWFAVRATKNWARSEKNAAKARENEDRTKRVLQQLRRQLYLGQISQAWSALRDRDQGTIRQLLDACPDDLRGWEWRRLNWLAERRGRTVRTHLAGETGLPVTLSPDGRCLAVQHGDRVVTVWQVPGFEELATFALEPESGLSALAFDPDGDRLGAGGSDGTIRVWDVRRGTTLRSVDAHSGVETLAFAPGGERMAFGCQDGMVAVWDAASGEVVKTLGRHEDEVNCVAYSPDGRFIGSASRDGTILVWLASSGNLVNELQTDAVVEGLAFRWGESPIILAAATPRSFELWEVETGAHLRTIRTYGTVLTRSAQFSADGQQVLTAGGALRLRDAESWDEQWTRFSGAQGFSSAAFLGKEQIVAVDREGGVLLCRRSSESDVRTISQSEREEWFVKFSPNGEWIASAAGDGTAHLWNAGDGQLLRTFQAGGVIRSVAFSPQGQQLATASLDGHVKLWNVETGVLEWTLEGHSSGVSSATYRPDGKLIATASNDHTVRLWETDSGRHLRTYAGHSKWVWWVDFSPDGERVVSGSTDGELRIWDPDTAETVLAWTGHERAIDALRFSPDGRRIASGSYDGAIKIWDSDSGELLRTLRGHGANLSALVYAPSGSRLFSVADDFTLRVWNPDTGQELLGFPMTEAGSSIDISPHGNTLVVSSTQGGTIELWETTPPKEDGVHRPGLQESQAPGP